ncbi:hypothetical protein ABK040_001408 [Willaertia magna]
MTYQYIKENLENINALCPMGLFNGETYEYIGYISGFLSKEEEFLQKVKDNNKGSKIRINPIVPIVIPKNGKKYHSDTQFATAIMGKRVNFREAIYIQDTITKQFFSLEKLVGLEILRGEKPFQSDIIPIKVEKKDNSNHNSEDEYAQEDNSDDEDYVQEEESDLEEDEMEYLKMYKGSINDRKLVKIGTDCSKKKKNIVKERKSKRENKVQKETVNNNDNINEDNDDIDLLTLTTDKIKKQSKMKKNTLKEMSTEQVLQLIGYSSLVKDEKERTKIIKTIKNYKFDGCSLDIMLNDKELSFCSEFQKTQMLDYGLALKLKRIIEEYQ